MYNMETVISLHDWLPYVSMKSKHQVTLHFLLLSLHKDGCDYAGNYTLSQNLFFPPNCHSFTLELGGSTNLSLCSIQERICF